MDADARSTDSGLGASPVIRNDGRQPRKRGRFAAEAESRPKPDPRAEGHQREPGCRERSLTEGLTAAGANSRVNHFILNAVDFGRVG
jgi:hypothetical protein